MKMDRDRERTLAHRSTYETRMMARFGYKRESSAPPCPLVVAGKRCASYTGSCICQRYYWTLLDHHRLWLTHEGDYVLTAEPYDIEDETLEAFRREIEPFGITLDVTTESLWFSGTTLLVIRRHAMAKKAKCPKPVAVAEKAG